MQELQLHVGENNFLVSMTDGAVCLYNSESLENFLEKNPYQNALLVAHKIHEEYKASFSKSLDVSLDSIAVEILGHIYFENFIETIGNKIPLQVMDTIYEKIHSRCKEINIGERGVDHNRSFWDLVTPVVKKYFD